MRSAYLWCAFFICITKSSAERLHSRVCFRSVVMTNRVFFPWKHGMYTKTCAQGMCEKKNLCTMTRSEGCIYRSSYTRASDLTRTREVSLSWCALPFITSSQCLTSQVSTWPEDRDTAVLVAWQGGSFRCRSHKAKYTYLFDPGVRWSAWPRRCEARRPTPHAFQDVHPFGWVHALQRTERQRNTISLCPWISRFAVERASGRGRRSQRLRE